MTANQISYARLNEDKRHNQVMEAQGWVQAAASTTHATAAMSSAAAQHAQVAEAARHNRVYEHNQWEQIWQAGYLGERQVEVEERRLMELQRQTDTGKYDAQTRRIDVESSGQYRTEQTRVKNDQNAITDAHYKQQDAQGWVNAASGLARDVTAATKSIITAGSLLP